MTECNHEAFSFLNCRKRQVKGNFFGDPILEREGILAELIERRVEVRVLALVLPSEAVALPHVRPTISPGILPGSTLKAVTLTGRIGLGRRPLSEQPAQIEEVLLRCGTFLQRGGSPLRDEFAWAHPLPHPCKVQF